MRHHPVRLICALLFSLSPLTSWSAPGDLDTTFGGGDGWVTTPFYPHPVADEARSVIQQSDGKLVAAGYSYYNDSSYHFALARYTSDGLLDTSFNGTGQLVTAIGESWGFANAVIQQSDGKLVAAGLSQDFDGERFVLVRYNNNGSLDTSFDGDGLLITTVIGGGARTLIEQADGKLVVAGSGFNGSDNDFAVLRYNNDGSLDTTFNGTGIVLTDFGSDEDSLSLTQQADGKLVAAGHSSTDFALARYNPDGSLDTTFNGTGMLTLAIGDESIAKSVIQQADGKLVAAGYGSANDTGYNFAIVRFNDDGSPDATFNETGVVTTDISVEDVGSSVIQQPDGKLVVAGNSYYSGDGDNSDVALLRYNADGSLDATFNGTGVRLHSFSAGGNAEALSLLQQPDGRLVVAGYSYSMLLGTEFLVARFENAMGPDTDGDGVPDSSDAFPLDPSEWLDTDSDGTGNNADIDDDGDGVPDYIDADPLSAAIATEKTLLLNGNYKGSTIKEGMLLQ